MKTAIDPLKTRELLIEETAEAIWARLAASIWPLVCRLRPGGAWAGIPEVSTAPIKGPTAEEHGLGVVQRDVDVGHASRATSGRRRCRRR